MKPVHDLGHGPAQGAVGQFRPVNHDDRDGECPGSKDFRFGSSPARVLGDKQLGAMRAHQLHVVLNPEGAARDDHFGVRQGKVCGGRIDRPGQETMLPEMGKAGEMLSPDRQEHPFGGTVQLGHGSFDVRDTGPVVARLGHPGGPLKRAERHPGGGTGERGVAADPGGKGMGRIHHLTDAVHPQEGGKPVGPAEAAAADGHRLRTGACHPSGIRQNRGQARIGHGLRKVARLGGAAQDEGGRNG